MVSDFKSKELPPPNLLKKVLLVFKLSQKTALLVPFRVLSISHFYLELQHDWEKPALREIKEIIWGKGFVKLNTLNSNVAMKLCEFLASSVKIDLCRSF